MVIGQVWKVVIADIGGTVTGDALEKVKVLTPDTVSKKTGGKYVNCRTWENR